MMGGGVRPPGYTPPAGTASGIPGASYPVMGSTPVTNMQPRYAAPGMAQMRPGMPQPPAAGGTPPPQGGLPPQAGGQPGAAPGANPQQLASALTQLNGGMR
jgi:hypothetical protein